MSSEKTATDELRRMLDERGVEYDTGETVDGETVATFWYDREGYPCSAIEGADDIPDGEISMQACATPEQAIAATVGRGTCHKLPQTSDAICVVQRGDFSASFGYWTCSECGAECFEGARYCMNCGAKVVDE